MDRDQVGSRVEIADVGRALHAELLVALGGHIGVVGDDRHAECLRALGDELADAAEADDPERLLVDLDSAELAPLPLAALSEACACGMLRAWASSSAIVCSAAATMFDSGALATITPRFVAAGTSTLSTPMPARPITFRRSPRSIRSAVSLVAGADHDPLVAGDRTCELVVRHLREHVDVEVLAEQLDTGVGDLLLYEDPVAVCARHRRRRYPTGCGDREARLAKHLLRARDARRPRRCRRPGP